MIMYRIIFLFLTGILYTSIHAQTGIRGTITDEEGIPLPGATIFLPEQNKGTVSDNNGLYIITSLPSGKIKIQYSFLGYKTKIREVNLAPGELTTLNVSLKPAVIESQEVVVTGIGISAQHDNAVKIEVLKNKDIRQSGTPNFMEALTMVPGVDMIAKGQGVAKPVIRGLSMNDILVLNNGVRIENYQYSENHPLGVSDNDIDKVEIIKGPASLLYGSDAIGGVLNFTKEKPAPTGSIRGYYETRLHSNTKGMNNSLGIKGASEHLFGGISANQKTHADYKQGGGEYVPNTRFNEWSLSSNTGYTGKTGTFRIFYDYYKQQLGMSVPAALDLVTGGNRKNRIWYQDLDHHLINSRNTVFLRSIKWETNLAWQSALRKLQTITDVPNVEMRLNTFTYESKLHLTANSKSDYTIGIQGMLQTNRNLNDRPSQFLPDADVSNFGILFLAQYSPWKTFKIQGGLRYDIFDTETFAPGTEETDNYHAPVSKDYSSLNGSLGATYTLNQKMIFRANVAKAYRVPNLSELTSNGIHGNRYERGNPDLNPQNAWETDLSAHYHGDFVSFDAAIFYNRIKDYIFIAPTNESTTDNVPVYQFSQTNAKLYGGEAGLHFHPEPWPWLHLKGTWSTVTGKQDNDDYLPFIPAGKFRYEVRASKNKMGVIIHPTVKISALTALKQDHQAPTETPTDGYTIVNGIINGNFKAWNQLLEMTLGVNNIFDTQYYDHLSTLKPLGFYNQGRNVSVGLNILLGN
jgi:iron complex outermembrane receptor protein